MEMNIIHIFISESIAIYNYERILEHHYADNDANFSYLVLTYLITIIIYETSQINKYFIRIKTFTI